MVGGVPVTAGARRGLGVPLHVEGAIQALGGWGGGESDAGALGLDEGEGKEGRAPHEGGGVCCSEDTTEYAHVYYAHPSVNTPVTCVYLT